MIDKEVEIMVIYQALETPTQPKTPEDLGYPPGFFEQTYGICASDPIVIDSPGEFETVYFGQLMTWFPGI